MEDHEVERSLGVVEDLEYTLVHRSSDKTSAFLKVLDCS